MNRRSVLRSLAIWFGAVAAVGLSALPAQAHHHFFRHRFHYHVHRSRRRLRWRVRLRR